jgi:hypothetical protein
MHLNSDFFAVSMVQMTTIFCYQLVQPFATDPSLAAVRTGSLQQMDRNTTDVCIAIAFRWVSNAPSPITDAVRTASLLHEVRMMKDVPKRQQPAAAVPDSDAVLTA